MSAALAVGVGCRRGASAEAIVALVRETLAACEGAAGRMFTHEDKASDGNLRLAAETLALALVGIPKSALAAQGARAANPSEAALRRFGLPSVAEAAALAGAGEGARIVASRKSAGVTCAVASR